MRRLWGWKGRDLPPWGAVLFGVVAGLIAYALAYTDLPWWAVALAIVGVLSILGALLSAWQQNRRDGVEPPTL